LAAVASSGTAVYFADASLQRDCFLVFVGKQPHHGALTYEDVSKTPGAKLKAYLAALRYEGRSKLARVADVRAAVCAVLDLHPARDDAASS